MESIGLQTSEKPGATAQALCLPRQGVNLVGKILGVPSGTGILPVRMGRMPMHSAENLEEFPARALMQRRADVVTGGEQLSAQARGAPAMLQRVQAGARLARRSTRPG